MPEAADRAAFDFLFFSGLWLALAAMAMGSSETLASFSDRYIAHCTRAAPRLGAIKFSQSEGRAEGFENFPIVASTRP